VLCAGAIAVTDNRLVSEGAGEPGADLLSTTVVVGDFGVSGEWTMGLLMALAYVIYFGIYGTASANDLTAICALATKSSSMPGLSSTLPAGKVMFNDNQVSFLMRDAPQGYQLASVLLFSLDDIASEDNQFEYYATNRLVFADLIAAGFTVRSNDNRLAETWGRALLSLFSIAILNTAADNQSTHCMDAVGLMTAVHDNLELAEAFCHGACDRRQWREQLLRASQRSFMN
jgi:hypothetical protein